MSVLQAEGLKPGIYFGLPEETYHNDPAISRSDIKMLNNHVHKYWLGSWMSPSRQRYQDTEAKRRGRAYHKMLFEPQGFYESYYIQPGDAGFPVRKVMIMRYEFDKMMECIKVLRSMPRIGEILEGGFAEVTIVWVDEHTGLRCRCRFDYLKVNAGVDYKTTERQADISTFGYDTYRWGYDIQASMYPEGLRGVRRMLKNGEAKIYGATVEQRQFCERLINPMKHGFDDDVQFAFILQEINYPYAAVGPILVADGILQAGESKFRAGLTKYLNFFERHGPNTIWVEEAGMMILTERDVPQKLFHG